MTVPYDFRLQIPYTQYKWRYMYHKWVCWPCKLTWYPRARKWIRTETCPLHDRNRPDMCCAKCWVEDKRGCTGQPRCRNCSQQALRVNPDFRPPKKDDTKAWAISQKLFQADANRNPRLHCTNRNVICEEDYWFCCQYHTVNNEENPWDVSPVQRDVVDAARNNDDKTLDHLWYKGVYTNNEDYVRNIRKLVDYAAYSRRETA